MSMQSHYLLYSTDVLLIIYSVENIKSDYNFNELIVYRPKIE